MIIKRDGKWYVLSEHKDEQGNRKNLGGPYGSYKEAAKRLQQVEYFKHKKGG